MISNYCKCSKHYTILILPKLYIRKKGTVLPNVLAVIEVEAILVSLFKPVTVISTSI